MHSRIPALAPQRIPAKKLQVDNDGNPVSPNGGLHPIVDTTPSSVVPAEIGAMPSDKMPPGDDSFFA